MKMKLMLMVAMVCFVGPTVFGNLYILKTAADAYIDYREPDANFGTGGGLAHSQSGSGGSEKSYVLFDLSGLASIRNQVTGVQSISYLYGGSQGRTINLYMIREVDGIDTWTETGITWNNAPGNNVSGANREFGAYDDETITGMGQFGTGSSSGWKTVVFTQAQSDLLLAALTSEDFKVTIGARHASSNAGTVWLRSSEYEGTNTVDGQTVSFAAGEAGPYMTLIVPEPATLVLLGLGSLSLLRKRK